MPDEHRTVLSILPSPFHPADAGAVIGLAAAAVAFLAATGNDDPVMMDKLLRAAWRSVERMRHEAREHLCGAAAEMVDAVRDGKHFMVLGGFQQPSDQTPHTERT